MRYKVFNTISVIKVAPKRKQKKPKGKPPQTPPQICGKILLSIQESQKKEEKRKHQFSDVENWCFPFPNFLHLLQLRT